MDISNIILTGWGTETLPPEILQKLGYPDAAQPMEVALARAVFQETTWVMLVGACMDLGMPALAGALRAIQLGQYMRQEMDLAANKTVGSAQPAAVAVAQCLDAAVSWLPAEQLAAAAGYSMAHRAPVIVPARLMPLEPAGDDRAFSSSLAAEQLLSLLRQNDPLAVFVSLVDRNDWALRDLVNDALRGVKTGTLPFTTAHFQEWTTAHQLIQAHRLAAERQSGVAPVMALAAPTAAPASLTDVAPAAAAPPASAPAAAIIHPEDDPWRSAYPALAAAWQRLTAAERQAADGAVDAVAMGLVRNLDHASQTCLGILPRPQDVPAFPASATLLENVRQRVAAMQLGNDPSGFFLGHKREHCRQVWRRLCMWLANGDIASLMQFV